MPAELSHKFYSPVPTKVDGLTGRNWRYNDRIDFSATRKLEQTTTDWAPESAWVPATSCNFTSVGN